MRALYFVYLYLAFSSCTINDSDKNNKSKQIERFLALSDIDSIATSEKLIYNDKAYAILRASKNDSSKFRYLFKVANRYYNLEEYNKYGEVSKLLLQYCVAHNDSLGTAKSLKYLADYYYMSESPSKDSALYYVIQAEKSFLTLSKYNELISALHLKATILFDEKDFYGSESASLNALKYLKYTDSPSERFKFYILLSNISNELSDYEKALNYLNKAHRVVNEHNLDSDYEKAIIFNNIGNIYQNQGENNLAVRKFEHALADSQLKRGYPLLYSILLDNLAFSKHKLGDNSPTIIDLFKQSILIKDSLKNISESVFSKSRLAEIYYSRGEFDKALNLNKSALSTANLGDPIDKLIPLKQLSQTHPNDGLRYAKEYIYIKDSLQTAERKTQNKFARIQYETDEITSEKELAVKQKWIMGSITVIMLVISGLLFIIKMQRAKQKESKFVEQQQKANGEIYSLMLEQQAKIDEGRQSEKQRIGRDLHDGIMNKLASTRLNLFILNKKVDPDTISKCLRYISDIQDIEKEIRDIAHDLNKDVFGSQDSFEIILNSLFNEQKSVSNALCHFEVDAEIRWESIDSTSKINIYRILQEAFQNINKHAYAEHIVVNIIQKTNNLMVEISDDGIGFDKRKKIRGIGISNMRQRVRISGGKFDISTQKKQGTKIKLLISI